MVIIEYMSKYRNNNAFNQTNIQMIRTTRHTDDRKSGRHRKPRMNAQTVSQEDTHTDIKQIYSQICTTKHHNRPRSGKTQHLQPTLAHTKQTPSHYGSGTSTILDALSGNDQTRQRN